MILKPTPTLNTDQFHWHKQDRTFTAESSDLGWPIGWPPLGQVYDDAIDEGFTLISTQTGAEVVMAIDNVDRCADYSGGWRALTFKPAKLDMRESFRVVVFND